MHDGETKNSTGAWETDSHIVATLAEAMPAPSRLTCFLVSLLRVGRALLQVRRRPCGGPPGFWSLLRSG